MKVVWFRKLLTTGLSNCFEGMPSNDLEMGNDRRLASPFDDTGDQGAVQISFGWYYCYLHEKLLYRCVIFLTKIVPSLLHFVAISTRVR